mmetsp:Transcript_9214/g.24185  ORF Transcript_9214/g.24185 Transcript_9214/m.24185 type:complete len:137 (-) Transcript_9214:33-443(-)
MQDALAILVGIACRWPPSNVQGKDLGAAAAGCCPWACAHGVLPASQPAAGTVDRDTSPPGMLPPVSACSEASEVPCGKIDGAGDDGAKDWVRRLVDRFRSRALPLLGLDTTAARALTPGDLALGLSATGIACAASL